MVRMEEHLQKSYGLVDGDGLELARLEPGPLIRVQRQKAKFLKLYLIERQSSGTRRHRIWIEGEQFDFTGNL